MVWGKLFYCVVNMKGANVIARVNCLQCFPDLPSSWHTKMKWWECSWAHNFFFKLQVPKVPPEVWLCPALRPSPTGLPHPHRVWGQRLPGAVLSNTRFTFSLLLNYLHLPFDQQFILRNNVILVLYNSTFLVDCCVEFCEKYLRKGLYCINKLFVCCELWHPISVFFCNLPSLHALLFSASQDLEQLNLTGKLNATVFWVVGNIFSLLILRHW